MGMEAPTACREKIPEFEVREDVTVAARCVLLPYECEIFARVGLGWISAPFEIESVFISTKADADDGALFAFGVKTAELGTETMAGGCTSTWGWLNAATPDITCWGFC